MSHLKYCPAKNGVNLSKMFSNEIEVKEFDFGDYHWFIKGKKGFMSILHKINNELKGKGYNVKARSVGLIGALYTLNELEIVEKFHVKPIKPQQRK